MAHSLESKHLFGREAGLGVAFGSLADFPKILLFWMPSAVLQTPSSDSYCQLPPRPPVRSPVRPPAQPRNGSARRHLDQVRSDHCAHGVGGRPRRGGGIPRSVPTAGAHWPRVQAAAADWSARDAGPAQVPEAEGEAGRSFQRTEPGARGGGGAGECPPAGGGLPGVEPWRRGGAGRVGTPNTDPSPLARASGPPCPLLPGRSLLVVGPDPSRAPAQELAAGAPRPPRSG